MKQTSARRMPDRRVQRTRRQLRESMVGLILERGWDRVSVQDVCARADIGRSTFYLHFADKEELLFSGFDELHASLDAMRLDVGPFSFAETLIQHAMDNLRLYRALAGKRSGHQAVRRLRDVVLRLVDADLERLRIDRDRRADVARYVTGGFIELMTTWLDRPSGTDAHALAATFQRLTRGVLSCSSA